MNNVFNDFLMLANIQFVENVSVLFRLLLCMHAQGTFPRVRLLVLTATNSWMRL